MSAAITTLNPFWKQQVFAAGLVARMRPNYQLFAELSGEGDAQVFGSILDIVWEHLAGYNQKINFDKQLDKLEVITPDPAQFDMYGVWPALDSCVALACLVNLCEHADEAELLAIMDVNQSTIGNYLQAMQISDDAHPLQSDDIALQQQLIAELQAVESPSAAVRSVRKLLNSVGLSNIGLEGRL